MLFRKYNIIGILILFFHFNGLSQDTLKYTFIYRLFIDEERSLYSTHDVKQYYVNDSVFVIEEIYYDLSYMNYEFESKPPNIFKFQFKIENDQWLMKFDAEWKVFFNGKEDTLGSWKIDGIDMKFKWEKTNVVDLTDTVYSVEMTSDNPKIITQLENGRQLIEYIDIAHRPTLFFTYSSGFIAFRTVDGGAFIREDKEYLRDFF